MSDMKIKRKSNIVGIYLIGQGTEKYIAGSYLIGQTIEIGICLRYI